MGRLSTFHILLVSFIFLSCSNNALDGVTFQTPSEESCGEGEARCGSGCVDTLTNPLHCGGCSPCTEGPNSLGGGCEAGVCQWRCREGFEDTNGDLSSGVLGDGCECREAPEVCDGRDNDCDGVVDNDVSNPCGGCGELENLPGGVCGGGECGEGQWRCHPTQENLLQCEGENLNECGGCSVLAQAQGDPCGECSRLECRGAELVCVSRVGDFFRDEDGDGYGLDGDFMPLCEASAPYTATMGGDCDDGNSGRFPGALEVCDGVDNSCNDIVDALDPNFVEEPCALQRGVCRGSVARCEGGQTLDCASASYIENNETFEEGYEVFCDGADNDCDGDTDENCCVDGGGLLVGEPSLRQIMPGIAVSGDEAMLVWLETGDVETEEAPAGRPSLALRSEVLRRGVYRGAAETNLGNDLPSQVEVSSHSLGYDVVSVEGDGVEFQRFDTALSPGAVVALYSGSGTSSEPALASAADGNTLVAWKTSYTISSDELFLRHISPEGILSAPQVLFSEGIASPAVDLTRTGGIVAAHNDNFLNRRVSLSWAVSADLESWTTRSIIIRTSDAQTSVAAGRDGYRVVYVADLGENDERPVIATFGIDVNGEPTQEPVVLTDGSFPVSHPRTIALQSSYAVAWVEGDALSVIRYQRFSNQGRPIGDSVVLSSNEVLNHRPFSLAAGPGQNDPQRQVLWLLSASAASENLQNDPEKLVLRHFIVDGRQVCFVE